MQFVKPAPFKEAITKLGQRTVITSGLDSAAWQEVPVALRERAFFSSQVESARFLQRARNGIADFLQGAREDVSTDPSGGPSSARPALKTGSRADFIKQLQDFALAEGLGPLDPADEGTLKDIRAERRLAMIFDTQTRQASDFGYWQQGNDPAILEFFPAQRFIRERAVKEPRDMHIHHEGEVHLKSDLEFWIGLNSDFGVPWGPWGWGCGHGVEDVERDEAIKLGLLAPGEAIPSPEVDFNHRLQASVQQLDPDLVAQLKESFGGQIKIQDNAAWWKGDRQGKSLAIPKPPAKPKKSQSGSDSGSDSDFPAQLSDLEEVRQLGGSTGATLVRDRQTGAQFVRKLGASAAHLLEETIADNLYRALGAPVPESKVYESGPSIGGPSSARPVKLARFVQGATLKQALSKATAAEKQAILGRAQQHFAADALLGNWDAAGLDLDNMLVASDGTVWRIDNGGSLRFRAQGARKTADQWDAYPTELWTLRDPAQNAQTAQLFGSLDIYGVARQIEQIDGPKLLAAAPDDLKPILSARLENMKAVSSKALEYEKAAFVAPHADQVTRHMIGLRKADAFTGMADELKQAHPGDVRPVDKDGNPFDLLRTPAGKARVDPSETFFQDILAAAKTVNHHHTQGSTAYNPAKLSKAIAHKPALQNLLSFGSTTEKAMAHHYLGFLSHLEKAQGDTLATIPNVAKHPIPIPAASPDTSITARLANYMNANGGDWSLIERWANNQGNDSKSDFSRAVKTWFKERLNIPDSEFWDLPSGIQLQAIRKSGGEKLDRTLEIFHAGVQEILQRVKFTGNDQAAGLLRVLRTETNTSAVPFKKGSIGDYKRGVNESGSIFAPARSGTRTVTIVPHARVTGLYFLERSPGSRQTFFLTDGENEITYIAAGFKAKNLGVMGDVNLSPGTSHTLWETK